MNTQLLMTLSLTLGSPQPIGARKIVPITGGTFEGPRLRGHVHAAGGDWTTLRADGTLVLDIRTTLETDDGARIQMTATGLRHGPPEVLAALARGEVVDPSTYYFRITPRFETNHPKYAFLRRLLAVATGDRRATGPIYTVHEVL